MRDDAAVQDSSTIKAGNLLHDDVCGKLGKQKIVMISTHLPFQKSHLSSLWSIRFGLFVTLTDLGEVQEGPKTHPLQVLQK